MSLHAQGMEHAFASELSHFRVCFLYNQYIYGRSPAVSPLIAAACCSADTTFPCVEVGALELAQQCPCSPHTPTCAMTRRDDFNLPTSVVQQGQETQRARKGPPFNLRTSHQSQILQKTLLSKNKKD